MKKVLLITAIVVCLIASFLIFKSNKISHKSDRGPVKVSVSEVVQKNTQINIDAIGTIQAYATINVKSLVDGQLVSVGFTEGDLVQAGQVIFKIDSRPFEVALQQAQANLTRDQAQLDNAIKIYERAKTLRDEKNVSQQDFDQLETNVRVLKGAIEVDNAAVAAAKLQLDYCTIRSPVTGYTGSLLFNVGNIIQAKDPNPLVIIKQIIPIYASFSVPEQYLPYIKKNMDAGLKEVTIVLEDKKTRSMSGQLSFINNTVDINTGNIQLKATIPNQNQKLWPGQFVKIILPLKSLAKAKIIPSRAILAGINGFYVYVVDKENKVDVRTIKEGPIVNDETIILDGLNEGEMVVTEGQLRLTQGAIVSIDEPEQKTEKVTQTDEPKANTK
ncbi:MAG: efflux RND transporter periplasmic adaptor subunit [Candidatus Berkiella sp.]